MRRLGWWAATAVPPPARPNLVGICVGMQWFRRDSAARFQPVADPTEGYSPWDRGWRLLIAWCASLMIVLIGLANLAIALEVLEWWMTLWYWPW